MEFNYAPYAPFVALQAALITAVNARRQATHCRVSTPDSCSVEALSERISGCEHHGVLRAIPSTASAAERRAFTAEGCRPADNASDLPSKSSSNPPPYKTLTYALPGANQRYCSAEEERAYLEYVAAMSPRLFAEEIASRREIARIVHYAVYSKASVLRANDCDPGVLCEHLNGILAQSPCDGSEQEMREGLRGATCDWIQVKMIAHTGRVSLLERKRERMRESKRRRKKERKEREERERGKRAVEQALMEMAMFRIMQRVPARGYSGEAF